MRSKNLKIQMLAGNSLKICVGAGFEISSTLEMLKFVVKQRLDTHIVAKKMSEK